MVPVARAADGQIGFDATLLYGINYPADTWVPLRLQFHNATDHEVSGDVVIPVERAVASPIFRLPVIVPARSRVSTIAHLYFPSVPPPPDNARPDVTSSLPSVAIAQWESGGARIGRVEIYGRNMVPDQIRALGVSNEAHPEAVLLSVSELTEESAAYSPTDFGLGLTGIAGSWIESAHLNIGALPRALAGYAACKALVLDQIDPDRLDAAQRQALFNYISSGGTLILPCPRGAGNPADSWLAPYLPVQIVGERQMNQIIPADRGKDAKPFALLEWLPAVEAIDGDDDVGDSVVLLRDRGYVHAAYKSVGSGRVIFTSFPINALDMTDPRVVDLWSKLINLKGRRSDWSSGSALSQTKQSYLQSMIGLRTPPWTLAVGIAAGYVLLVTGVQFAFPGARRPRGFAVASVAAIVLSVGLIATTALRQQGTELTGARLTLVNLNSTGGGIQQEVQAFYGNDQTLALTATNADVTIQPLSNSANHPTILLRPFQVPEAAVHAGKVEQVWNVEGILPSGIGARAVGRFGPDGLSIAVDNRLNGTIEAPLLVWEADRFSLGELPPGESTVVANRENRNLPQQYTNVSLAISENATLRGRILRDLISPAVQDMSFHEIGRFVAGWLPADATPNLLEYSPQVPPLRNQTLARLPLRIEPTPVGTEVSIDGAFMRIPQDLGRGLFDHSKNEWLDSLEGSWLLCFAAPREIGQLRTRRVTIEADLQSPQHTIVLRRGQVAGGTARETLAGPVVAEWTNALGKQTVSFDVDPADADANGYVWLLLDASYTPLAQTGQVTGRWKFRSFNVSYESEVIGGPDKLVPPQSNGRNDEDE